MSLLGFANYAWVIHRHLETIGILLCASRLFCRGTLSNCRGCIERRKHVCRNVRSSHVWTARVNYICDLACRSACIFNHFHSLVAQYRLAKLAAVAAKTVMRPEQI